MARILFVVPPFPGHLYPALAVADALSGQGHRVAWATQVGAVVDGILPGAPVYDLPLRSAAAPDLDKVEARGLESVQTFFRDYAIPLAEQTLGALQAAVRSFRPDVLVVDHQVLAGALVARALQLPWITLATSSASIFKVHPTLDAWIAEALMPLQQAVLPPDRIVERPDFSPHGVIVFSIEALAGHERPRFEAAYHFVGATRGQGRPAIEFPWGWLRPDQRSILVTLGTVNARTAPRFFQVVMDAVATMPDLQAVLVASESLAAQAPANVLVRERVPQLALLEQVDAVICHAGHNTVCEALAQGLPLIVSPIRHDQPVVAEQVVARGAGLFLRHGKATAAATRAAIERLLAEPGYRERAQELAGQLRAAPGAAGAAALVAALIPAG